MRASPPHEAADAGSSADDCGRAAKRARRDDGDSSAWQALRRDGVCALSNVVSAEWLASAQAFVQAMSPCVRYGKCPRSASAGRCAFTRGARHQRLSRRLRGRDATPCWIDRACFVPLVTRSTTWARWHHGPSTAASSVGRVHESCWRMLTRAAAPYVLTHTPERMRKCSGGLRVELSIARTEEKFASKTLLAHRCAVRALRDARHFSPQPLPCVLAGAMCVCVCVCVCV